jgi:hypothetical protein
MELVPAAIPNAARGRKDSDQQPRTATRSLAPVSKASANPGPPTRHELDETTHAELDDVGVLVVVISNDASRSRKGKCPTSAIELPSAASRSQSATGATGAADLLVLGGLYPQMILMSDGRLFYSGEHTFGDAVPVPPDLKYGDAPSAPSHRAHKT